MARPTNVAWAAKVSAEALDKLIRIAESLLMPYPLGVSWLLTCIAFETGSTFSPSVKNMAGSGAVGLIQFMPATAIYFFWAEKEIATWTTEQKKQKGLEACEKLAAMTVEEQLDWVYAYFKPYKGKLNSLEDVYMAILWPKAIGKPMSYVLWDKATRPTTYRQNIGLDGDKDGVITKGEVCKKINAMLVEGTRAQNMTTPTD